MIQAVEQLGQQIGIRKACAVLGVVRSQVYRARRAAERVAHPPRPKPERSLSATERQAVLAVLSEGRFQDSPPREVYATLMDEGRYLCSWRTMYRILHAHQQVQERRNQRRHTQYARPELLATHANQLWSWDITRLRGLGKWTYFYLYVILDVFSRYVVGWTVALQENTPLAQEFIATTCERQGIQPGQLTVHADRGQIMTSKPLALLLSDLGVTKTHSRPHVSNDNPYSEAQFKTLKYGPTYPDRFSDLSEARRWCWNFFTWYNHQHHHTGIALLTPADVHYGRAQRVLERRQQILETAYQQHPERFVKGLPRPQALPAAVWINPPAPATPWTERGEPFPLAERFPEAGPLSRGIGL